MEGAWIHGEGLTEAEVMLLVEKFSVEEGHLRDALDPVEVPRLEVEEGKVYVFTRVPLKTRTAVVTIPLLMVLGGDFVLTVTPEKLPLIERTMNDANIYTTQHTDFLLRLFGAINAAYARHLTEIARAVRSAQGRIERISNRDIIRFVEYGQILNDFLAALVPTATIMRNLLKGRTLKLEEADEELTEDVLLETGQLIETSQATLKHIVNVRDAYSTIMTHELNRVMKMLTALTIVFTVPTMISSFYGMNVRLPFDQNPLAYLGILMAIILTTGLLLAVLARNRWL